MSIRNALNLVLALGLIASLAPATARADDAQAYRFTFVPPTAASDEVQGPGAARGVRIIIFPPDGPGARSDIATPECGGDCFQVNEVNFLNQAATDCDEPKSDLKDEEIEVGWGDGDCTIPLWVELCIRTSGPIGTIDANFVDEFGGFAGEAEITQVPGCDGAVMDCGDAVAVTPYIWPPDHKLTPVTISGVTGAVTIVATGITQDEPLEGLGDGDTCPDGAIEDGVAWVRMERSGIGDGRVYVVSFTATDAIGATCEGQVEVCVPHDPDHACGDDGQTVNSLGECSTGDAATQAAPELQLSSSTRVTSTRGSASLDFSLPTATMVDVGVFDVAGRRITAVERGQRAAGAHRISWSVTSLQRGVYFVRLRAGATVVSRTLLIDR